jgi:unsaturated chondroitin disaccharide hydrolase
MAGPAVFNPGPKLKTYDFETGSTSQWGSVLVEQFGSQAIVTSPVKQGTYAWRSRQDPNNTAFHRAELQDSASPQAISLPNIPGERYYRTWFCVTSLGVITSGAKDFCISQFRMQFIPSAFSGGYSINPATRAVILQIRAGSHSGQTYAIDRNIVVGTVVMNKWHLLETYVRWSRSTDGITVCWFDGARTEYTGANVGDPEAGWENKGTVMFRIGIYAGPHSGTHEVVYDDAGIWDRNPDPTAPGPADPGTTPGTTAPTPNPVVPLNVTAEVTDVAAKASSTVSALAATAYPNLTDAAGAWTTTPASGWTAGFFPGLLWDLFERLGATSWRDAALAREAGIDAQKTVDSHDLGFMFQPFTRAFDLTGSTTARASALTAASTVSARWNAAVGAIRSWNPGTNGVNNFNTIIDSMMNMRLLFWAARNGATDAATLYSRALAHAKKVQANHVRPDGGTYHVVEYDATTGAVISRHTAQGYADTSTWARGHGWGLVGFVAAYEETRSANPTDAAGFLATAQQLATYITTHVPADNVPRWDFDAPATDTQKDTSAAVIMATGLFRLARIDPSGGWAATAKRIMEAVAANYKAPAGWASVLGHSVSNKPGGVGIDVGATYTETFWLRGLVEYEAASTATPAAPTGVQVLVEVAATGKPRVTVSANPVAGLIAGDGYQVYRDGVLIAGGTAPLPSPSYVDQDATLDWAQTHEYRMGAGQANRFGPWSDPVTVTLTQPADATAPTAPGKPTATAVTATTVALSWPASAEPDLAHYLLERAVGTGAFSTLATVDATSYLDAGLTSGTAYTYRLRAVDNAGNLSTPGQSLTVTPAATPAVPTGLAASSPQPRRVALTWTAVAGAQGYRVKRDGAVIAEGVPTNSFTDLNLTPGEYVYTVAAGVAPNVSADAAPVAGVAYGIRTVPPTLQLPDSRVGVVQAASLFLTGRGGFSITDDAAWLSVAPTSGALSDAPVEVVLTSTPTAEGAPNTAAVTLTETAPAGGVPVNTVAPSITGTAQSGQTLTGVDGTWSGSPTSYARKWYRNSGAGGTWVQVATTTTYALTAADVDFAIRFGVVATNASGASPEAFSAQTAAVAAAPTAPVNTGLPTVSGTTQSGQTLTGSVGSWTQSPAGYAWKWQRETAAGSGTFTDIAGATGSGTSPTFVLTGSEVGLKVRLSVTATNAQGSTTALSNPTATVTSGAPTLVLARYALALDGADDKVVLSNGGGAGGEPLAWGALAWLTVLPARAQQSYTIIGFPTTGSTPGRSLGVDRVNDRAGWGDNAIGTRGPAGFPADKWVFLVATRNNDAAGEIRGMFCDMATGVWSALYDNTSPGAFSVTSAGSLIIGGISPTNTTLCWSGRFLAAFKAHAFYTQAQMQALVSSQSGQFYVDPAALLAAPSVENVWSTGTDPAAALQDLKGTAHQSSRVGTTVYDAGSATLPLKVS